MKRAMQSCYLLNVEFNCNKATYHSRSLKLAMQYCDLLIVQFNRDEASAECNIAIYVSLNSIAIKRRNLAIYLPLNSIVTERRDLAIYLSSNSIATEPQPNSFHGVVEVVAIIA